MKHIFIINPEAGKGKALTETKPEIERIMGIYPEKNIEIYITKAPGDAEKAAADFALKSDEPVRIYACGGDGTLNEVANGIKGIENAQLGCVPVGTGNDFVRNFSNKKFFSDITRQINGQSQKIDLIKCNDRYCVNMLNIGFDCNVVEEAAKIKRNTVLSGFMAYIAGIFVVFKEKYGFDLSVSFDGGAEISGDTLLCAVANGGFCGGGFHSSLSASVNDGFTDAYLIRKMNRLKFLCLLPGYRTGKYIYSKMASGFVTHERCKEAAIKSQKEFKFCNDGEIFVAKKLNISIEKEAISFVVPEGCLLNTPEE